MKGTNMPAEFDERIIDENYNAVFTLCKEQIASHVCSEAQKKLSSMRVRLEDDKVICESTDGKALIQVKEPSNTRSIGTFPFDVNPSEADNYILSEPRLIPGETLDSIAKGFPKRKNFQKLQWQKTAVFSYQKDSKEFEVGRSDKQGRATIDKFQVAETNAFPPVKDVLESLDPKASLVDIRLDLGLLKKVVGAMENAGTEYVKLSLWGSSKAMKLESVDKWGSITSREVTALLMPVANKS
jgi:hypothetical protein